MPRTSRLRGAMLRWLGIRQPGTMLTGEYAATDAGVLVSEDMAMRLSTVHACVRVLSEDIAALPIHVYTRGADGSRERARNHPLYGLLHDRPNPEMTAISFKEAMMVSLLLTGNAYAYIEYDNAGQVHALWPMLPGEVSPRRASNGEVVYQVGNVSLGQAEVLHIPGMSYDGLMGLSPIAYARESIGLSVAAERFGSTFFKNGTHLGGMVTIKGSLSDAAFERMRQQFATMYRGLQNAHGVPVLEEGAEFKPIGIAPEDAQFLETRKFQRSEIAAIYRVPPHMIGDLDRATFSNIEHQDLAYLQRALLPWLVRWEQALQRLLLEREREDIFIEFDTANFMRGDTKSRMEAYATAIQNGIMTPNEARARENLNPIEGGDVILLPLNMQKAGEEMPDADTERKERSFKWGSERRTASIRRAAKRDALREAIAAWLRVQARDVLAIAREVLGKRDSVSAAELKTRIDAYYAEMAGVVPEDVQAAVREIAHIAFERVNRECKDSNIPEKWIEGFLRNYYSDMSKRLMQANTGELERIIKASESDAQLIKSLEGKLGTWSEDRAADMATHERNMALNSALVAGYKRAGYYAIWQADPRCCKACQSLNGQKVTTLRPPLHKGCGCTVKCGERIEKDTGQQGLQNAPTNDTIQPDAMYMFLKGRRVSLFFMSDKQQEHILGTENYKRRMSEDMNAGNKLPTAFYDNVDVESLVRSFMGKGRAKEWPDGSLREFVTATENIGYCPPDGEFEEADTDQFCIQYSKRGWHAYPVRPSIRREQ